jgi:hypothetical protein
MAFITPAALKRSPLWFMAPKMEQEQISLQ